MDEADRLARNHLFQELKPTCVKLSQLALKNDATSGGMKELGDTTAELYRILDRKCRDNAVFDDKLADYVFFPISHVLRLFQNRRLSLAELATKCVRILLEHGWSMAPIDLGHQLLLLFTLFAGGGPAMKTSEELQVEAFGALAGLFRLLGKTPKGAASLVEMSKIPALGQSLAVILDGIVEGASEECQLAALQALRSLWLCIKDQQALSSFLPGTISALTKALMPTIKTPRSRRELIAALDVLKIVLTTVLSDVRTRNLKDESSTAGNSKNGTALTKSWLKATAGQVKLALANVIKLRTHNHEEVRIALERTCLEVLDECLDSLTESSTLLVETAMSLASSDIYPSGLSSHTSLSDLATVHPVIGEIIKGILYNWVTGLPRVMQSNDETTKQSAMLQLSKAHILLSGIDAESGVLDDAIGNSLKDSVLSTLDITSQAMSTKDVAIDGATHGKLNLTKEQAMYATYHPIVMSQESQYQTRESFKALITSMSIGQQVSIANDMLRFLKLASGHEQLSAFWLSFQLLKAASNKTSEYDDFMSSVVTSYDQKEAISAELYAYSVSILVDTENGLDWRVQAVALEIVAYTAKLSGDSFRLELVDTIFPVVQLLGSNNGRLREHAIATLNIMAKSCAYIDTSSMIVENVDYLVNAISLKLNTFDISPQAPQVLVMMIRLSGSSLLPYLDDVVGSIFAALDNFHGYPRLVDGLFSVLGEIVDESSRYEQVLLSTGPDIVHRKTKPTGLQLGNIVTILEAKNRKMQERKMPVYEDFPKRPWKDATSILAELEHSKTGDQAENENENEMREVQNTPPTKVYTMVQNITRLGQHYLTSESPVLRRKLLKLISTACDGLYRNEDQFLPLVNDIWPVLVKRLYDEESYVVIEAASTISGVLRRAGDFMATRIQTEWHDLIKVARQARVRAEAEKKGRHGRGVYSQNWQQWEAFIQLLITAVEHVRINDNMFDEVVELLGYLLKSRQDIHAALSTVNEDAIWLEEWIQGNVVALEVPRLEGYEFAFIDLVA